MCNRYYKFKKYETIGGSRDMPSPLPNQFSFIFMQFSGKIWPNNRFALPSSGSGPLCGKTRTWCNFGTVNGGKFHPLAVVDPGFPRCHFPKRYAFITFETVFGMIYRM